MNLSDYLADCTYDELYDFLMYLDKNVKSLHQHGFFVLNNLKDVIILSNAINIDSLIKNSLSIDYGYDSNGINKDILELAIIGLCSYNDLDFSLYDFKCHMNDILNMIKDNFNYLIENENIPLELKEYYKSIILNGERKYISTNNELTDVDKYFQEGSEAYVNILYVPSIMLVIILLVLFVYFLFLR